MNIMKRNILILIILAGIGMLYSCEPNAIKLRKKQL